MSRLREGPDDGHAVPMVLTPPGRARPTGGRNTYEGTTVLTARTRRRRSPVPGTNPCEVSQ